MATAGVRPRKSLGQNFLRNDRIAQRIAAAVNPQPADVLLEIGPGEGALSRHLAGKTRAFVVVEIDHRCAERARVELGPQGVDVREEDILLTDLTQLGSLMKGCLRVVGNIPYNITSPIIFHLLHHRRAVRDALMMMQREVARRVVAGAGSKEYGILSVLCQQYADARLLFDVAPGAFYPRPAVMSSVVQLTMLAEPRYAVADEEFFRAMVRGVFGKRRKMLRSSLTYFLGDTPPGTLTSDLRRRPEDLSISELADLSNQLVTLGCHKALSPVGQ